MNQQIFLEFKFPDKNDKFGYKGYSKLFDLLKINDYKIIVPIQKLQETKAQEFVKEFRDRLILTFDCLSKEITPENPDVEQYFSEIIEKCLKYNPEAVILDSFRYKDFDNFHDLTEEVIKKLKKEDSDRTKSLLAAAKSFKKKVNDRFKTAYFAYPIDDNNAFVEMSGQDNFQLSRIFDYIYPMMYIQLLHEDELFIQKYLEDMRAKGADNLIPILQGKSFPDGVKDEITISSLKKMIESAEAAKAETISWFSWDNLFETGKEGILG